MGRDDVPVISDLNGHVIRVGDLIDIMRGVYLSSPDGLYLVLGIEQHNVFQKIHVFVYGPMWRWSNDWVNVGMKAHKITWYRSNCYIVHRFDDAQED